MTESRFWIDHGVIHDRVTGRHVTTDETMYVTDEEGNPTDRPIAHQADIMDCLVLLNILDRNQSKPLAEQGCVHCNPIKRFKLLGDPSGCASISFSDSKGEKP